MGIIPRSQAVEFSFSSNGIEDLSGVIGSSSMSVVPPKQRDQIDKFKWVWVLNVPNSFKLVCGCWTDSSCFVRRSGSVCAEFASQRWRFGGLIVSLASLRQIPLALIGKSPHSS